MRFERFQNVIEYNKKNQERIASKVRNFYFQMNMDYEKDLLNLMMIVRPLFSKKNYLVVEMPFKDREIGAICYKADVHGYTILNSALPKVNVNFTLGHEIYHVFYQDKLEVQKVELYINEHYFEHEEEMSANLFAGILLMPEPGFVNMFNKFKLEQTEEDSVITIIAKLMSYFEVPYMAALIRCYELGLLSDGKELEYLLDKQRRLDIEAEFTRLWLNEDIFKPTKRDDYQRLEQLVLKIGEQRAEEEVLTADDLQKIIANMRKIYDEIRG